MASCVHLLSESDLTEPPAIIISVESSYGVSVQKVLGAKAPLWKARIVLGVVVVAVFMTNHAADVFQLL